MRDLAPTLGQLMDLDAIIAADRSAPDAPLSDPADPGIEEPTVNGGTPEGARQAEERPFALPLHDFIAAELNTPAPLIGTDESCILPAYGLLLLVAKGGKGKTTATIDAVLHLASGVPWLGFEVVRPLRILLIENEGPREPFRRKLERRLGHWPPEMNGAIHVYAEDWGQARLDNRRFIERLNRYIEDEDIDLVVGDPLDTLGMEGVGSPEDTRKMMARFQDAGLFSRVAWWVDHHSRKDQVQDAIDEASGAWGGKPDALLGLEKLPGNKARLSFTKLRWGRCDCFAYLLGYEPETEAFGFIAEESDEDRDYAAEAEQLLRGRDWMTATEIAAPKGKGGIGAGREQVEEALNAEEPERFISRTGEEAKALGRKNPNATVWSLASAEEQDEQEVSPQGSWRVGPASCSALKSKKQTEPGPDDPEGLAPDAEQQTSRAGCVSHPEPAEACRYCAAKVGASEGRSR